jgi:dihydropteroate synthase
VTTGLAKPSAIIMGVVNVTPDSFSDGGRLPDTATAIAHARGLLDAGADILDIGGEATNPRATPVTADEELRRVMPLIEGLIGSGVPGQRLSIDTTKADVAVRAVRSGVRYVNDISGGQFDDRMSDVLSGLDITYICGHLRGRTIAEVFSDENRAVTWQEVADELAERLARGPDVPTWVDPGIGFGKGADPTTNLALVHHAGDLGRRLGRPVVVGPSRKRFLRTLLGGDPSELDLDRETVRVSLEAVRAGAHVVRVHNVALLHATLTAYNST